AVAAGAVADLARRVRDFAGAVADIAGDAADHLAERRPRHLAQLAGAAAAVAGLDRRPRLGAVAMAVGADDDRVVGQLAPGPGGALVEGHLALGEDAAARRRAAASTAERAAEGLAEEGLEDVVDRAEAGTRVEAAGAQPLGPVLIVGSPALGVG